MKWTSMSSPTPSVDSLSGAPTLSSFLEGGDSGLGLDLANGCHGSSSSSSTCSSIIFPHLSISNGILSNGYGSGSPEHLRSLTNEFNGGLSSPISNSSGGGVVSNNGQISSKCGICHDNIPRPKIHHTFCQDCVEKNTEISERIGSPASWEEGQQPSQSYSATLELLKSFETASTRLQAQYIKAQNEITEAFAFYRTLVDERKNELLKELESIYTTRQVTLSVVTQRVQETLDRMYQAVEFGDRLIRDASPPQVLVFRQLLETRLQSISSSLAEPSLAMATAAAGDLEFVANFSAMQAAVRNTLGYIRSGNSLTNNENVPTIPKQSVTMAPIARPVQQTSNGYNHSSQSTHTHNGLQTTSIGGYSPPNGSQSNGHDSSSLHKRNSIANNTSTSTASSYNQLEIAGLSTYEKWSNASEASYQNGQKEFTSNGGNVADFIGNSTQNDPLLELTTKLMTPLTFPKVPAIKRQKMIYHCKFGEFGTSEAQFTEPSGVTVNANNEIIVADTNNHRIQIFDKEGRFKFQFGECGKRDGQLLYPNRVAVVKTSGDIVVTERSPTHQIQIYNQYGQFVRKFGANILQHPRGVTVDSKGRIIVVECKVMRVIIFDQMGTVLHKFSCSKHLEFPNGVVVNERQEIFISDNRAHCVKVFNYEGVFLRQIGGEGLTNYPIGVGINQNGEILVADNHNNFNLTIFNQDGQLVSALESKVKHAQCFDVALMDDGSVVLASKDYRLYIYRYVQVPPFGM